MNPEPTIKVDPNIFKKNFEALRSYYPELAIRLASVQIEKYRIVQSGGNLPNVILPDNSFYYLGNLQKYCEEQFKVFKLKNVRIPVFCGFGLGFEVMYWLQFRAKEFGSQVVMIIENDLEMFMCAMNVSDLTSLISNPKIHFFVGIPAPNLYSMFREHFLKNLQETLMCGAMFPLSLYPSMKMGKPYYMNALQTMYEAVWHTVQNFGNCAEDGLIGLENMLDNIDVIVKNPGINLLYDKFKGKPAIIVATGPSLKKNMHLLKGLEDKALLISVDASFKLLMKNGIVPHMVTSLEREHEVQQFFDGFDKDAVKDVYMAACPVLYNHVYESYTGPQIIVYRNFDHFKWTQIERGILDIKLSSSNMAFKIAEALGCDPIILVGNDLAYGENDETHATEVPFSSEGEAVFEVPGNLVEKIKTNSGWYNFLKAFEIDVSQYQGTVINCTEGGALIPGTKIAPFADTIEHNVKDSFDPLSIIKNGLSKFVSRESDIETIKKIVDKTEIEVVAIIQLCIDAVETSKKYEMALKSKITTERLEEIRKEIITPRIDIQTKYADTFQKFLMHVVQSTHLKFEMECVMMITDPKEMLLQFKTWYSFVGDISEVCLASLRKAKAKLNG